MCTTIVMNPDLIKIVESFLAKAEFTYESIFVLEDQLRAVKASSESEADEICELLDDLAYFVPDPEVRKDHPSYYGVSELTDILRGFAEEVANSQ